MFNINDPNNIQLVSLPPEKFFNYEEGNGSNQHEQGELGVQMDKMDGSLISTFIHFNDKNQPIIRFKSKTSLTSSQACQAMELFKGTFIYFKMIISKSILGKFKSEIENLVNLNYTVNMEYTSPSNRIVIYYPQSQLTVLSIRSHLTGETLFGRHLQSFLVEHNFESILSHIVPFKSIPSHISHNELRQNISEETQGEGYVVEIIRADQSSYLVKIKTKKYLHLHHCKDSVNSPKHLFETVINEQSDDLRSLFKDDQGALEIINKMEEQVRPIFNKMVQSIEQFYEENKSLSRKDYAILINNTPSIKKYLGLLMNLYSGKVNDYKQFSIAHAKDIFGINDNCQTSSQINAEEEED
jgi:T4 RnlA family RNA ligase